MLNYDLYRRLYSSSNEAISMKVRGFMNDLTVKMHIEITAENVILSLSHC